MKIKDMERAMEAGDLVVVLPRSYGDPDYGIDIDAADRRQRERGDVSVGHFIGTLAALRQPRRVYSGERWEIRGHISHTGVHVTDSFGKTHEVAPKDVIATLDEYRRISALRRERIQTKAQALEDSKARALAVVEKLGFGLASYCHDPYSQNHHYTVTFTLAEAERLAERS